MKFLERVVMPRRSTRIGRAAAVHDACQLHYRPNESQPRIPASMNTSSKAPIDGSVMCLSPFGIGEKKEKGERGTQKVRKDHPRRSRRDVPRRPPVMRGSCRIVDGNSIKSTLTTDPRQRRGKGRCQRSGSNNEGPRQEIGMVSTDVLGGGPLLSEPEPQVPLSSQRQCRRQGR